MTTRLAASPEIAAPPTRNRHLIRWVEKMTDLCQPARVHWLDGSDEEDAWLKRGPGRCRYLHASSTRSSGPAVTTRAARRTMSPAWKTVRIFCSLSKDNAGPTNKLGRPLRDAHRS